MGWAVKRGLVAVSIVAAILAATATTAAADSAFVVGDGNVGNSVGNSVDFWGADWSALNVVSGGPAPASFMGFATTVTLTTPCTGTFTTKPGNSSNPPPTVGSFIEVLVANSITKKGNVISGTFSDRASVQTNQGYAPDPDQPGTGTVRVICSGA
jgi:hypothetical protein